MSGYTFRMSETRISTGKDTRSTGSCMSGCGMSWENDGRNAYRHSRDHIEKRKTHCHKYNNTKNNHTKGMGVLLIMNNSMKLMLEMSQGSKLFVCQGDITKLD